MRESWYVACMFKRKTVFIVGAGASQEAGFPLGTTLAKTIGKGFNLVGDEYGHTARFADRELFEDTRRYLARTNETNQLNMFGEAAKLISEGITLSNSIDDFLNIHAKNPYVIKLGKAAIVQSIINAEKKSNLFVNPSNIYNRLTFTNVEQTWFAKLMRVLGPGGSPETVADIFKNVAFITFNYDRCIEHFLTHALSALYGITKEAAEGIVGTLTIIHPYGKIASLEMLPFGGNPHLATDPFPLSDRIRTYTEQVAKPHMLALMHDTMHNASCLVFLGFSYLEQNMALLRPTNPFDRKTVLGTAFGLSDSDRDVVYKEILSMFAQPQQSSMSRGNQIIIDNKIKCAELFDSYARTLNAA